jgi:hypothetical protein
MLQACSFNTGQGNIMAKRKTYCTNLDADLMKEIRVLSALQVKRQNELLEEAIKDLLDKYRHLEPSLGFSMTE